MYSIHLLWGWLLKIPQLKRLLLPPEVVVWEEVEPLLLSAPGSLCFVAHAKNEWQPTGPWVAGCTAAKNRCDRSKPGFRVGLPWDCLPSAPAKLLPIDFFENCILPGFEF